MTIDSFALFFIYFYVGHIARNSVFRFAGYAARHIVLSLSGLLAWGILQSYAVQVGLTEIPGVTLIAGFSGALAVVVAASLLASLRVAAPLVYCGRNSLAIYLSFVLPMAAMRILLLKTGAFGDAGMISAIVSAFAIVAPLGTARRANSHATRVSVHSSRVGACGERKQSHGFADRRGADHALGVLNSLRPSPARRKRKQRKAQDRSAAVSTS